MSAEQDAADAAADIREEGQPVTLTRFTDGGYDVETGTVSRNGTTYTGYGIAMNYKQRDIDGTNIKQGDQRVYIGADLGTTPVTGDTLTIGGTVFQVVLSSPLAPAGVVLMHDVQVRA